MERAREDADDLRTVVVEGREREERLERELALLGAKLAVAEADQRSPAALRFSPSPRARVQSVPDRVSPSPTRLTFEHLTPARQLAAAYRDRTPSSSSSSLLNGFDGVGIAETPLMGQTLTFGPKSSYGSNVSPTKALRDDPTNNPSTARVQSPMQKPLILGSLSRNLARRISKESTASSEYGEHLPPPVDRP